jgi:ribosomal protein L11 methylase PrmA
MTRLMPRHSSSTVLDFLGKRGESSAVFFFPFLTREMTLLDIGCGPGAVTAALASRVKRAIGIDIEPHAIERARDVSALSLRVRGAEGIEHAWGRWIG